jgi:NADH:ubiquinone oxidoreductase subunit E
MIAGCILATGCVLKPTANATAVPTPSPTTVPPITVTPDAVVQTAVPVLGDVPEGVPVGKLNVSIGTYNAKLPVYIDNMSAGQVSPGKQLSLKIGEGIHSVKVCTGAVCEMVGVEIKYGVKATIDFEQRLDNDDPQGSLLISSGDYPTKLPVFIDNTSVGNVSPGEQLKQVISQGQHIVKVCNGNNCFSQNVTITITNQTSIDFGDMLKNGISQGSLTVSIGGFPAIDLPVEIDDLNVGNVSQGRPLDLMLKEGNHSVQVCSGTVCESQDVQIRFAKESVVDFGKQLKADIEFPTPTIRIIDSMLSGTSLSVEVEFINPDKISHDMTAKISCVYTYTDSQNNRKSDSVQTPLTRTVKGGDHAIQWYYLSLSGGSNVIANPPIIADVEIK